MRFNIFTRSQCLSEFESYFSISGHILGSHLVFLLHTANERQESHKEAAENK